MESLQIYDQQIDFLSNKRQVQTHLSYISIDTKQNIRSIIATLQSKYPNSTIKFSKYIEDVIYELVKTNITVPTFILTSQDNLFEITSNFPNIIEYLKKLGVIFSSEAKMLKKFLIKSNNYSKQRG